MAYAPGNARTDVSSTVDRCLSLETLVGGRIGQVTSTVLYMHGGQHGALERYELRTCFRTDVAERAAAVRPTAAT